ncbi:hypothetical protein MBLNU13_g04107t2 [Cladosporium sp. NU13]
MDEVQLISAVARVTQPPHLIINLRAEVEAAVKPYVDSIAPPPFCVAEIMTMAWRIYTSSLTSSRRTLRRTLGNETSNFDCFFELPAEVRLMIYEEVLRVPARELQYDDHEFDPRNKSRQLRLSSRGERHECSYLPNWSNMLAMGRADSLSGYKPNRWATEPTPDIMALLRVNRQVFEEAMPVFFHVNNFHANSLQELTHMLQHCGARRRACFSNISFDYGEKTGPRTALKAFRLLYEAKYLHSLQISIEDKPYLESGPNNSDPTYRSPGLMPGMELLGIIPVRELKFSGTCPKIGTYLRPRMLMKEGEAEKMKAKFAKRFRKSVKKTANP